MKKCCATCQECVAKSEISQDREYYEYIKYTYFCEFDSEDLSELNILEYKCDNWVENRLTGSQE